MTEIKEAEKLDNYLDDKPGSDIERLRQVIPVVIAAAVGFCFSQVDVFSTMSPFSAAFMGVVPFDYCAGVFIGSVIGHFAAFSSGLTIRYVLCLCFICFVRLLVHKRFSSLEKGRFESILVLVSVTCATLVYLFVTGFTFVGMAVALLESGISFCSSYFFSRSFRTPVGRIGLIKLSMADKLSLFISMSVFVMCFSGISIEGFSPARLLSCMLLCFAAYCKGVGAGSVTGICLGASLSIDPEGRFVFPAFALGGLVSGVFAPMGQIAAGVSLCVSFCICCVIGGLEENFLVPMIECAVASAAFMLVPPVWLAKVADFVQRNGVISDEDADLQVSSILKSASGNIYSFCQTVDEVSTRLDRVINPEVNKLFFEIQQNVCDGCSKKSACWSRNFDSTARDVLVIMGLEKRGKGKLQLEKHCSRLHELKNQASKGKAQYSLSMLSKMKNREMRRLLTEQFSGLGDFLSELSQRIAASRTVDEAKSTALRSVVIDKGVYIDSLNCFGRDGGKMSIEITCFEKPFETDYKKIKSIIEEATGRHFEEPEISASDMVTLLKFDEKAVYTLVVGTAQRPFVSGSPCGDSISFCTKDDICKTVLLSDGMGTGSSAALDSVMTVSLLEKLLSGGFSFESGIRIVNSSLIMKSTDESMATVDGLSVNLFTGEAEFFKAGAAISFIRSDREIFIIEESSLPLGILREVHFEKTSYNLKPGDIVLLVSDGITAGDCGWINDELLSWSTNNMDDLAGHIVELAALRQDRFTGDDLTAVAVKLLKSR